MSDMDDLQRQLEAQNKLKGRPSRARYNKLYEDLDKKWRRRELKSERMMREIVDALWDNFAHEPYSWVGFYTLAANGVELILGPHRDKPACSPIQLHGVCGKALKTGQTQLVADVKALGDAHIECDPNNRSEIAVPVFNHEGKVWAVLDVDSAGADAFDEMDQRWLERICRHFENVGKPA